MTRLWQRFVNRLVAWWRGRREPRAVPLTTKPPVIGAPTMMINPETKRKRGKKYR
jgi:hypothetical protein